MKTIYSDGKSLEIEQILNITVFLPQPCYFCGEDIEKMRGRESRSLVFHSLDGDHDNWDPDNKVPCHRRCHVSFHHRGKIFSEEQKQKIGDSNRGEKNSNYGDKVSSEERTRRGQKGVKTRQERYGPSGRRDPERYSEIMSVAGKKVWKTRRERYGPSGCNPEVRSEATKKAWKTRRERYGPTGMRPKTKKKDRR